MPHIGHLMVELNIHGRIEPNAMKLNPCFLLLGGEQVTGSWICVKCRNQPLKLV